MTISFAVADFTTPSSRCSGAAMPGAAMPGAAAFGCALAFGCAFSSPFGCVFSSGVADFCIGRFCVALGSRCSVDGVCVDGSVVDGVCVDGSVVDGVCVDGSVVDGVCVDGSVADGSCGCVAGFGGAVCG